MKISFVTVNLLENDAVGNDISARIGILSRAGHDCRVFVSRDFPAVRGDCASLAALASYPEFLLASRFADRLDPSADDPYRRHQSADLAFYNYFGGSELYHSIALPHRGVKVFDYHGVTPPELVDDVAARGTYERGVRETALVRHADFALVRSAYMRDELARTFGFPADRITVLPYETDTSRFTPGPRDPALAQRYGLAGRRVLLYVGRMASHKKIDELVRALAAARREIPDAVLLLAGNTSEAAHRRVMEEALRRARELGVGDSVIFTGEIDHAALPAYYRLCDLFVTASRHEGFCIPVIEAMACGKPVIGARATALPDTIGDGGLLFEPGDHEGLAAAAVRLLRETKSGGDSPYRALSRAALARAGRFSAGSYRRAFLEFVERAAKREGGGHTPEPPAPPAVSTSLPAALSRLCAGADVSVAYLDASPRRFLGRMLSRARGKVTAHLRRFYLDILAARQSDFNRSAARTADEIATCLCILKDSLDALDTRLHRIEKELEDRRR